MNPNANFSTRDPRIDLLKAISILFVLIWHLQPIQSLATGSGREIDLIGRCVAIFYHYIALLAVPTFVTVSVYLFMRKGSLAWAELIKRLVHLGKLFLVWTLVQYLFYIVATGGFPSFSIDTIKVGGPDLPHVGGSVFYFLFVLFKITALSFLFLKLPETLKGVIAAITITASLAYFALSPLYGVSVAAVSTKNFYVYIPIAYYITKYIEHFIRFRWVSLCLFLVFIAYEEFVVQNILSSYARPSLLCGVIFFISVVHAYESRRWAVVEWLSRYSLGIFALHKYWQYLFIVLFEMMNDRLESSMIPPAEKVVLFLLVSALTFASAFLLSRTRLKPYVG